VRDGDAFRILVLKNDAAFAILKSDQTALPAQREPVESGLDCIGAKIMIVKVRKKQTFWQQRFKNIVRRKQLNYDK